MIKFDDNFVRRIEERVKELLQEGKREGLLGGKPFKELGLFIGEEKKPGIFFYSGEINGQKFYVGGSNKSR